MIRQRCIMSGPMKQVQLQIKTTTQANHTSLTLQRYNSENLARQYSLVDTFQIALKWIRVALNNTFVATSSNTKNLRAKYQIWRTQIYLLTYQIE